MRRERHQGTERVYYLMSDQPDTCGQCGARLDLIETTEIDGERVYVNECLGCHQEVLFVEE